MRESLNAVVPEGVNFERFWGIIDYEATLKPDLVSR